MNTKKWESDNYVIINTFPIVLKFESRSVKIEQISIPIFSFSQKVALSNSQTETFSIIKQISDEIGQMICPKKKLSHHRFEISVGSKYSLIQAFDNCNINQALNEICVCLGWDTFTDLDASILPVLHDWRLLEPICYYNQCDKNKTIMASGNNRSGRALGDDERITIKLSKIDSEIKYLVIAITSYNGLTFDKVNGAFCRIVDSQTKKEVMYLRISKKEEHTGILF